MPLRRTLLAACLAALPVVAGAPASPPSPTTAAPKALSCPSVATTAPVKQDKAVRQAAQRGLEYLSKASQKWTGEHRCFGCHVQAVTMEGLSVGKHHQYDVGPKDLDPMVDALRLGVTAGGHVTGVAFQGQAWARYDQYVDARQTAQLLRYANELIALQQQNGSVPDDDARRPITGGTMHTTYQAMQTWRQAFARTADDKWLPPMRKAEAFLSTQSKEWDQKTDVYLQDVNFALLGLSAAGVGPTEAPSLRLQKSLLARQHKDGSFGLDAAGDALATGQTVYALKLAGYSDSDPAIARAMGWLVEHQDKDGAWRTVHSGQNGAEKGEGMWAVLGLVTVDVMSVAVKGVVDGQHVAEAMTIDVEARDNQGGGVGKVALFLDDQPLDGACGPKLTKSWDTKGLTEGKHLLDVVATNARGQESRRRFELYAGNVYLTNLGARFDETRNVSEVTVRSLAASPETAGTVELDVFQVGEKDARGKKVFGASQKGAPGAMAFTWDGKGQDGKAQPKGRYLAEVTMKDQKGQVVQKEQTLFFQDTEKAQREKFAEVEGNLALAGGAGTSANTLVELVDGEGKVVQQVRSTEQGNYRFKSVEAGKYKVRVKKDGWAAQEASINTAPAAAPSKADFHL